MTNETIHTTEFEHEENEFRPFIMKLIEENRIFTTNKISQIIPISRVDNKEFISMWPGTNNARSGKIDHVALFIDQYSKPQLAVIEMKIRRKSAPGDALGQTFSYIQAIREGEIHPDLDLAIKEKLTELNISIEISELYRDCKIFIMEEYASYETYKIIKDQFLDKAYYFALGNINGDNFHILGEDNAASIIEVQYVIEKQKYLEKEIVSEKVLGDLINASIFSGKKYIRKRRLEIKVVSDEKISLHIWGKSHYFDVILNNNAGQKYFKLKVNPIKTIQDRFNNVINEFKKKEGKK